MIHVDVAGGTGDIGFRSLSALRAAEASARDSSFHAPNVGPKPGRIIICDINSHMLVEGNGAPRTSILRTPLTGKEIALQLSTLKRETQRICR